MIRKARKNRLNTLAALAALVLAGLGCSTDSPTAPTQDPAPPPGGPSTQWSITVSAEPGELTVGDTDPVTISVRVRRVDNGNSPPTGTTIVVRTTLGDLQSLGSGVQQAVLSLINGRGSVLLFAGTVSGSAFVSAQLEGSAGQSVVPVRPLVEPVVASFSFTNSNANLSVQFQNTSTGNPTSFRWDFGDGQSSREEHPVHIFPAQGDFVVSLTASNSASSDTTASTISIVEQPPEEVFITEIVPPTGAAAGGEPVTINGQGFQNGLRVFFGGKLATVNGVSSRSIQVTTPPGDLLSEGCDLNGDGNATDGTRTLNTVVQVKVENPPGSGEDTLAGGFTYLSPDGETCNPN